ncbi:MAG TPA: PAS domain S-box protein, partial [Steroidobacteraceae bacterium]|nr:PAS domain S-box protein [Steroidobacteraceae bacterium]
MNDRTAFLASSGRGALTFEQGVAQARASILLVDDQPARLLTYEAMLSGLELQCVRAQSGFEALQKLLVQEFAVIVLDVHMPEMDGFEVARLVREHPRLERTPIIFVTGVNVSDFDRLKGYEVGAIDYISVPVVPEILRSKVALLVELHQRRRELQALNRELHDTRSRIEAEHAAVIAEKESQLNAVFEHPDQVCVVLRPERNAQGAVIDWRYVLVNAQAERVLRKKREHLIGRRLTEVVGPEAEHRIAICNKVLETQAALQYESRFGELVLMSTVFPGGCDLVISSSTDVTERKRTEAALRATERRTLALIEHAPVGVCHVGMDGYFLSANRAFCDLVGYTAEELCKLRWQDITHPDDLVEDERLGKQVLSGETQHYTLEKRYIRKGGREVWIRMFRNFVRDDAGLPIEGLAIVLDITERKKSNKALVDSQERLLIAKRAAGLGIHDWNIKTGEIAWDERLYELWGFEPGVPVMYDVFAKGIHPEDMAHTQKAVDKALDANGDGHYSTTYRVINRRDGVTRWIEATGRMFFEQGAPVRLVGTVQDVTAQRELQDTLRESDRRKDEFLAMLAHELRNPVAPIRNAAEVLARLLKNDEQSRSLVAMIQRQSGHLSRILDDLLDVARITQGRIDLRREPVSVQACVELALEAVQPHVQAKGHRVTVTRAAQPLYVSVDKVRIEQCITNLLSNAVKYTDPAGDIRVRAFAEAHEVVIEVSDSGVGIAPEFVPRVFDLFAQSERSLDRSQGGLGIGLSICKQLIEMHGGSVHCTSAGLGHGSTFTLRLPRLEATIDSPKQIDRATATRERVLIVDDNSDAADSLALFLELEGHQTMAVYNSESALLQAELFAPQIVLLDI